MVSPFLDIRNRRYDFCKNSSNPKLNKGERETDRGDPRVNGPHLPATRKQRRGLTAGDLADGEVSALAKGTIVLPTAFRI